MEGSVTTATLTAGTLVSTAAVLKSRQARAALRKTIYAPIDEHRTAASNSDIAAAWMSVGVVALGLGLLAALSL
jgi:hypothetical protein